MTTSSGLQHWRISFEVNPISLVGGIVGTSGAQMPISILLPSASRGGAQNSPGGSVAPAGATTVEPDINAFGYFYVLPGASLITNQFAHYPFLNQTVAANSIITQPLTFSLRMVAPVNGFSQTYSDKLSIMTALKSSLDQHIARGGTFNVATPAYIYTNCLLAGLKDISNQGESEQLQFEWQWDFEQPLLTLAQATAAEGLLANRISSQTAMPNDPPSPPLATSIGVPNPTIATAIATEAKGALSMAVGKITSALPIQFQNP